MSRSIKRWTGLLALLAMPLAGNTLAAEVKAWADGIKFQPEHSAPAYQLRLIGPNGQVFESSFLADEVMQVGAEKIGGRWVDGSYRFEITPITGMAERRGDQVESTKKLQRGAPSESGAFRIADGLFHLPGDGAVEFDAVAKSADDTDLPAPTLVVAEDLIVQGSSCVGIDCTSTETFGFDTIRLKENNLRIKFDDTSSTAGFAATDWQLTANDSGSGGLNKFSIEDITAATVPVTVEGGSPSNSLYVDSTGRIGLGTSTPAVKVHVANGDSPTLRLEQNASSGFAPQSWDIAGNETNFFVRDVTGGSRLPFRIRPGAPTSSIDIAASGNVGIGTASPGSPLHVRRTDGTAAALVEEASATNQVRSMLTLQNNGGSRLRFEDSSNDLHDWLLTANSVGFAISEDFSGVQEFMLQRGTGNLTIAGTLTQNSDVNRKTNISPVDPLSILQKVVTLPISTWAYKEATSIMHLGPMAQDFHANFGLGEKPTTIATIDTSGVALASIQALYQLLQERDSQIEALTARLDALESRKLD